MARDSVRRVWSEEGLLSLLILGACILLGYKIQGLGDGITVPSLPWKTIGIVLGGILLLGGLAFMASALLKKKPIETKTEQPQKKGTVTKGGIDLSKSVEEMIQEERLKTKKKEDTYQFFPFLLLMSFHWIGILTIFAYSAYYGLYERMEIMTPKGAVAPSKVILLVLGCAAIAIPLVVHWVNLVNGKKGRRPVAFTIGWVVSLIGVIGMGLFITDMWFGTHRMPFLTLF